MSRDASVRGFVALELEPALRAALGELQERLGPALGGIRLVRPEGIHLTLRFLGQARPEQVEALQSQLADAARSCAAVEARVSGLGTFPERGSPRVLWLGVELPPAAHQLQLACERAARDAGFEPESRPFRPHLTLGRWRDRSSRPVLPDADLGPARLEWLALFRSETASSGAVYTPLARFRLAPA